MASFSCQAGCQVLRVQMHTVRLTPGGLGAALTELDGKDRADVAPGLPQLLRTARHHLSLELSAALATDRPLL